MALYLFDNITPPRHFRYEEEEVQGWFEQLGFEDVRSSGPVDVGICGIERMQNRAIQWAGQLRSTSPCTERRAALRVDEAMRGAFHTFAAPGRLG